MAIVAGFGLTSCETDSDPKLQKPTEFILNTPPMADQVYYFGQDAQGKPANDITFTLSQPDYGVGVTPEYTIQIARSLEDFEAWDEEQAKIEEEENPTPVGPAQGNGDNGTWPHERPGMTRADGEELPLAVMIDQSFHGAYITVPGDKFCEAVNTLYGFERKTYNGEIVPVYVRAHSQVGDCKYSGIWSNPIKLAGVRSYFKLVKGTLYIVGACQGWDINKSALYLTETEIGSSLYRGTVEIPANQFEFRFYTELGNWEKNSVGPAGGPNDDKNVNITDKWSNLTGYTGKLASTKDKFQIENWPGGEITIEVSLAGEESDWTVTMTPPEPKKLNVVGSCSGWDIAGKEGYAIYETAKGSGVFEGTVEIKAGEFCFKIYDPEAQAAAMEEDPDLSAWDCGHYGAKVEDQNVDFELVDGTATKAAFDGKGNWNCTNWDGGKLHITFDTVNMTITFTKE